MSDDKKPRLSVVRETFSRKTQSKLPPVPRPVPESAYRRNLRSWVIGSGTSLQESARLVAVGVVLADGASEVRPSMSAKAARAWIRRHEIDIDRLRADHIGNDAPASYADIRDLRNAVLGASVEVDEAGDETVSPGLVAGIYAVVNRLVCIPLPERTDEPASPVTAVTGDATVDPTSAPTPPAADESGAVPLNAAIVPLAALTIVLVPVLAPAMAIVPALALYMAVVPSKWGRRQRARLVQLHSDGTEVLGHIANDGAGPYMAALRRRAALGIGPRQLAAPPVRAALTM